MWTVQVIILPHPLLQLFLSIDLVHSQVYLVVSQINSLQNIDVSQKVGCFHHFPVSHSSIAIEHFNIGVH